MRVALLFTGIMSLACGGMPASDLAEKAVQSASGKPKLRVAENGIKKSSTRERAPSSASIASQKRKDEYVVKLRPGVTDLNVGKNTVRTKNARLDKELDSLQIKSASKLHEKGAKSTDVAKYLGLDRTIHIHTKATEQQVRERLEKNPDVEWVEPVSNVKSASTPNDPYFKYQWHMAMLKVTDAWEITMGEGVVVAVVDTGVSAGDDGFHKLLPGWDFVDNDADASDLQMHGTHVAGTIGQAVNNGKGVVGVAPKVSILPVRVLDANGSGTNTNVANGIVWAADHGANVINLSLGSSVESEVVSDACAYAYEKGVTIVAATGNDGFTSAISFPAAAPGTIAVGSVDAKKGIAFYSNQGQQIDLVAPGGDTGADTNGDGFGDGVLQQTILPGGGFDYQFLQGTSMATPHVAGVAALLYAKGVRDPDAMLQALTSTADDLGKPGWDTTFGHGLVNPVAALQAGDGRTARGGPRPGQGRRGQRGGADGANDGGSNDGGIDNARGKLIGQGRAVVGWNTGAPSPTMMKGSDGTKINDSTAVKMHRVTVTGKPGSKVTYTIRSGSETETVTVQF